MSLYAIGDNFSSLEIWNGVFKKHIWLLWSGVHKPYNKPHGHIVYEEWKHHEPMLSVFHSLLPNGQAASVDCWYRLIVTRFFFTAENKSLLHIDFCLNVTHPVWFIFLSNAKHLVASASLFPIPTPAALRTSTENVVWLLIGTTFLGD